MMSPDSYKLLYRLKLPRYYLLLYFYYVRD